MFHFKRNSIIGLVALAALASALETATLAPKWRAGASRTYTATLLSETGGKELGKVAVKVLSVASDGSAQVRMTNAGDQSAFTFTLGDHGKIEKDPGGKQGLAAGLSLLFVVPRGEATLDKAMEVAPGEYGLDGKASVTVRRNEDGKSLDVASAIVPKEGKARYVFLTTYAPEGGLPTSATLVMIPGEGERQIVLYKADDVK